MIQHHPRVHARVIVIHNHTYTLKVISKKKKKKRKKYQQKKKKKKKKKDS
jgi:hypothetical protein